MTTTTPGASARTLVELANLTRARVRLSRWRRPHARRRLCWNCGAPLRPREANRHDVLFGLCGYPNRGRLCAKCEQEVKKEAEEGEEGEDAP